jgi:antitoxin (DNA-binding transcriptional repressor) of toxin-antitoxin stability system
MSRHSLAEAKDNLPELIARAERGEEIVITRDGREVVRLSVLEPPQKPAPRYLTQEAIDWFDKHPPVGIVPEEDAGTFVSRMRDEEWTR